MNMNNLFQIGAALVLAVGGFFLANPYEIWMPPMSYMVILAVVVAIFGAFTIFVLKERPVDEREEGHMHAAGRTAFLAGGTVLIVGIIVQTLEHTLDPWLVWALLAMVAAKVWARLYSDRYQ